MTAEIAVANKWGIAIAADSAVTIEQMYKGKLTEKVYNSANKVFTLSKYRPVGAMVYNTMTLGGTPWETIIKMARSELKKTEFDRLEEYSTFLFTTLNSHSFMFPKDSVDGIVIRNAYLILSTISNAATDFASFETMIDVKIGNLSGLESVDGFDANFEQKISDDYKPQFEFVMKIALKSDHQAVALDKIVRVLVLSFVKKEPLSGYSGIVVCGFGRMDIFPKLVEFYSDIVICGRVRYWQKQAVEISMNNRSFVIPFADTEVIKTITEGVNPSFDRKQYDEFIKATFSIAREIISGIKELTDEQKANYITAATNPLISLFGTFVREMQKFRQEEYIDPIRQAIEVLPLGELANVAETFLSASQIHKRVTPQMETVGGPVDIAVISKGDGLVWIKRKHYFSSEQNPGYIRKYLDE